MPSARPPSTTSSRGNTRYTANSGLMELRKSIAKYMENRFNLSYHPEDEIFVTVGGSEGIDLCVRAFVEPGDEVLIPEPQLCRLRADRPADLRRARCDPAQRGKQLPADPRGAGGGHHPPDQTPRPPVPPITPPAALCAGSISRQLRRSSAAHPDIIILSDEIYAELTYNGRHVSIAEIDGMKERTIVVNGFSKAFSMTGWRLGYLCGPAPAIKQMLKIHQYALMCSPTTSQWAGVEAMEHCLSTVEAMREEYNLRRRFIVDAFNQMGCTPSSRKGPSTSSPASSRPGLVRKEFCERLLYEKKIAVVPGERLRRKRGRVYPVSYCYSVNHLTQGGERDRRIPRGPQKGAAG